MKLRTDFQALSLKGGETFQEREELRFREEMEARRILFEGGNKYVLFEALVLCAWFQAVMPDWVADALIEGEKGIDSGEHSGVEDIFEKPASSKSERKKATRIHDHERDVVNALAMWRLDGWQTPDGDSFNADVCFSSIGDKFSIGRRAVEEIYKKHKEMLISLPRNTDRNHGSAFLQVEFEERFPRRRGRPSFDE